jgi:hypothetical protein
MLTTFGDIKNSRVLQIASAPPDSPEFASLVNDACEQLVNRGNWWGTVQPVKGCVYDGCVTWPRQVASVLAMNVCGHPTVPANRWYEFMQWDGQCSDWAAAFSRRNRGAWGREVSNFDGTIPVFNPIPCGQPRYVRFYIDNPNDAGSTVRIYGVDGNGMAINGQRSDGTFQDGVVLTLKVPYIQTAFMLNRIDRVVKDVTNSRIRGYQVDSNGVLYDLCSYEASETSPDYVHTRIHVRNRNGQCPAMITALVKLAFVPVVFDDDLVVIENKAALRDMVMSIKLKEAGDVTGWRAAEQSAFRELNYELRARIPDEQFIVRFRPFGNDSLAARGVGMI